MFFSTSSPLSHKIVLGIGGSIALGDGAVQDNGYLQRTFHYFHDQYINKAIYGANSTQLATLYKGDYSHWLHTFHPKWVVISWGLLNDVLPNTSLSQFNLYLKEEIHQALLIHAKVLVVTPPVTEVSYVPYAKQESRYVQDEMSYVPLHYSHDVYAINLFKQMKHYITIHHLSISSLSKDAHHPNNQGHQLAATLLIHDLQNSLHL